VKRTGYVFERDRHSTCPNLADILQEEGMEEDGEGCWEERGMLLKGIVAIRVLIWLTAFKRRPGRSLRDFVEVFKTTLNQGESATPSE
jgi:hypothetical protein